jgi:hypothetical protein
LLHGFYVISEAYFTRRHACIFQSGGFDTAALFTFVLTGETTFALSSYQSYEKNRSQKAATYGIATE